MIILDITKKNGSKCTRMCDSYNIFGDILKMKTISYKIPHDDEGILSVITTTIFNVTDVKEVKRV